MNRLILVIIISSLFCYVGCGKKKESKYIIINNPPKLETDFKNFIEQRRNPIKQVLLKHGIKINDEEKDWLTYSVGSYKHKETDKVGTFGQAWFSGSSKILGDIDIPRTISLDFDWRNGKWALRLEDGYFKGFEFLVEVKDKTRGWPPEVHVAIKSIFPYHYDVSIFRKNTGIN